MINNAWTAEYAAVAADAAMDRGVFAAELWRYLPPEVVQQISGCPALFAALVLDPVKYFPDWAKPKTTLSRSRISARIIGKYAESIVWIAAKIVFIAVARVAERSSACAHAGTASAGKIGRWV